MTTINNNYLFSYITLTTATFALLVIIDKAVCYLFWQGHQLLILILYFIGCISRTFSLHSQPFFLGIRTHRPIPSDTEQPPSSLHIILYLWYITIYELTQRGETEGEKNLCVITEDKKTLSCENSRLVCFVKFPPLMLLGRPHLLLEQQHRSLATHCSTLPATKPELLISKSTTYTCVTASETPQMPSHCHCCHQFAGRSVTPVFTEDSRNIAGGECYLP